MGYRSAFLALALVAAGAATASAQEAALSGLQGLSLGAHLSGAAIKIDVPGEKRETGAGLGIRVGYGFTEHIQLIGGLHGSKIRVSGEDGGDYSLAHLDLGARYNFLSPASPIRPFAGLALNSRQTSAKYGDDTVDFLGGGLSLNGGVHYFLRPNLSLESTLTMTVGSFTEARENGGKWDKLGTSVDASSTRFDVGVSWRR